jgi:hypothetical protein
MDRVKDAVLMILRRADRPCRAWSDESEETLRRSCQLNPQQQCESRYSGTAVFGPTADIDADPPIGSYEQQGDHLFILWKFDRSPPV